MNPSEKGLDHIDREVSRAIHELQIDEPARDRLIDLRTWLRSLRTAPTPPPVTDETPVSNVHEGCGGTWKPHPRFPNYIEVCSKCREERAFRFFFGMP